MTDMLMETRFGTLFARDAEVNWMNVLTLDIAESADKDSTGQRERDEPYKKSMGRRYHGHHQQDQEYKKAWGEERKIIDRQN